MARCEAILIITIGLSVGLAIAATALLPLSHALTGGLRPYAPVGWFTAILGVSALLALVALSIPTRRALRVLLGQPARACSGALRAGSGRWPGGVVGCSLKKRMNSALASGPCASV
jgi:hypothetical protein